jgi:hypothetical protein
MYVKANLTLATVVAPEELAPPRTFYIQRWDDKLVAVQARSYYKTESTYVFTNISYAELKARWNRGSLLEVPPVLEVDVDAVIMIVDGAVGTLPPPATPKRKRAKRTAKAN